LKKEIEPKKTEKNPPQQRNPGKNLDDPKETLQDQEEL